MGQTENRFGLNFARMDYSLILLFSVAVFILFWALGSRGLWGSEGRWAEVTREMIATGDYFHPTIGGEPYYDKPLLTYWPIAAIAVASGRLNELIARIPSALAGLIALWATYSLGSRLWSKKVGLIAAWILLTCIGFVFWARTAAADMENLAVIILAVAWYWKRRQRVNFLTFMVFYLIIFTGALTKGLTAVAIPIAVVLPDMLVENRWKMLFKPSHFFAAGIAVVVYMTPFVFSSHTRPEGYHSSGLTMVFQENILRYFRPIDHKGSLFTYFYAVPQLLLPWAPIFVAALACLPRFWKKLEHKTRWLVMSVIIIFAVFTVSGSRRDYYILPILPFAALLIGVFVTNAPYEKAAIYRNTAIGVQKWLLITLILCEFAIPPAMVILKARNLFEAPFALYWVSPLVGLAAITAAYLFSSQNRLAKLFTKEDKPLAAQIAVTAIVFAGFFGFQQPMLDKARTEENFALRLNKAIETLRPAEVLIYPKAEARLLFYLDKGDSVRVAADEQEIADILKKGEPVVIIGQQRYLSKLGPDVRESLSRGICIEETRLSWERGSRLGKKWVAYCFAKE